MKDTVPLRPSEYLCFGQSHQNGGFLWGSCLVEQYVESRPELTLRKRSETFDVCSPTLGDVGFRGGDEFGDGVDVLEGCSKVCENLSGGFQSLLSGVLVVRHVGGVTGGVTGGVEGGSDSSQVIQRLLKVCKVIHCRPFRCEGVRIVQDLGEEGLEVWNSLLADGGVPQADDVGKDGLGWGRQDSAILLYRSTIVVRSGIWSASTSL